MKRVFCFIWLVVFLEFSNCSIFVRKDESANSPPKWVFNIPYEEGKIYAVGTVGKTLFQDDAWKYAADSARNELAKNLQGRIENAFLSVQSSGKENWAAEAYTVEATSWSTDIVMNNSQIVALWYDEKGMIPGSQPGTTYALAVINFSNTETALKTKIENKVTPEQYEKIIKALSEDFKNKEK